MDLNNDASIQRVFKENKIDYVMHLASPFPNHVPKNENELIGPAKEGSRSVIKACYQYGVKKLIVTSSIASVFTGNTEKDIFDESDWAIP